MIMGVNQRVKLTGDVQHLANERTVFSFSTRFYRLVQYLNGIKLTSQYSNGILHFQIVQSIHLQCYPRPNGYLMRLISE
ncbi:unnamed protein product [Adineta steineri]|uniref:Uncharacterized protein n=1 Tax=Adineta steineri TaxID=433720 RepID=A0A813PMK5_9BILA|nr:unnamed protein product [Adineta steineri]CAF0753051.1 unnamed protein product [Adineta steineri]CAF0869053.1 unnamed protein product [Adineta steineri]